MDEKLTKIKDWISKNELRQAILGLRGVVSNPFEHDIIIIESRFEKWNREFILGIQNEEERIRIEMSLLKLTDEIQSFIRQNNEGVNIIELPKISRNDLAGEIVKKLHKAISIDSPSNNDTMLDPVGSMKGKIRIDFPEEFELWVFQKSNGFYYHTDRPINIDFARDEWEQGNLNYGVKGKWELIICLVNEKAQKLLVKKINDGNWLGFTKLPNGVNKITTVNVVKK